MNLVREIMSNMDKENVSHAQLHTKIAPQVLMPQGAGIHKLWQLTVNQAVIEAK